MADEMVRENPLRTEIMTLPEIAEFLKLGEKTVMKLAQDGKLPGAKIGGQWRFMRAIIEEWLMRRMYSVPTEELYRVIETSPRIVPISRLITENFIVPSIEPGSVEDVLNQLMEPLVRNGIVDRPHLLLEKLMTREQMMTTAIAPDVAFPHPRDPREWNILEPRVVLGRAPEGTNFGALNGKKTYVFFLICSGNDLVHLRLMAKTALIGRDTAIIKQIKSAESSQRIHRILIDVDARMTISI